MTYAIFFKVEYVTNIFDLTAPQTAFELIFQLYNFLYEAQADNDGLREPERQLLEAKKSVVRKGYASLSKQKCEEIGNASYCSRGRPASAEAQDSFDNQSVQRELTRAGYTLTRPISEKFPEFTPLTPVSRDSRWCTR
jgi:hypothetical protein